RLINEKMKGIIMLRNSETAHDRVAEEIESLPYGFDDLNNGFRTLVAALRLHGLSVLRADEAKELIGDDDDLWAEMSSPSVWVYARSVLDLSRDLRKRIEQRSTPEYVADSNRVIKANLMEQQRLLKLLEEFYTDRQVNFFSQLIVETLYDYDGASYLRPQGASVRLIMDDATQRDWFEEGRTEMLEFGNFLVKKL
ncbi:MAG: hypothetical protein AAB834_07340, partial [Patescibacteria group bacterium]